MDSPHKLLDGPMDGLEADGRLRLPPNVTTLMAEDLRAGLVLAADHEAAILIDASETISIGQAALQLLIAAKLEADRMTIPFEIENAQEPLVKRIEALGLAETLGLTGKGEEVQ
ncbi:hypothetical protein OOT33_09430 [Sphingobium sp. DEHP117]|uniref:hypothetical protein n=1 Tax=Sphingobium sp. DEHP117 TaxID=2993436 RepID=UPI0027D6672C|nr:hypothetical protein [Sphingobium sp. DEHP117]MDQ4420651.1 hypothetical protein [Sphingobium sp. DEHP117]